MCPPDASHAFSAPAMPPSAKESARVAPPRIAARAACRILATPRKEVVSEGYKPSGYRPRFKVNLNHYARFVFLSRTIDKTDRFFLKYTRGQGARSLRGIPECNLAFSLACSSTGVGLLCRTRTAAAAAATGASAALPPPKPPSLAL